MIKHSLWVLLLLASHISLLSAQVREEWVARYNGPHNGGDSATAIAVDAEGHVYVTGRSGFFPNTDYTTVKYDTDGNPVWAARYNGPANHFDSPSAIALDGEGHVYVTGVSRGIDTSNDYATVKYDREGDLVWVARYDGPASGEDIASAIAVDADGHVYVTGRSRGVANDSEFATIKYDAEGEEVWVARYHGPAGGDAGANAIALDAEGHVYVTGSSPGVGTGLDYTTIKYDGEGNQLWVARYNGPGNRFDVASAIAVDAEGYIYVTGASGGLGTGLDYATVKYDGEGNQLWVARYNGPDNRDDNAYGIALDGMGNVYVTGGSWTRFGSDFATVKYDREGHEVWTARYRGPLGDRNMARAIAVDADGQAYVTGESRAVVGVNWDYATVKYDGRGDPVWVARYNGPGNSNDEARGIALDAQGNVYVTGGSFGGRTGEDYATIKYSQP